APPPPTPRPPPFPAPYPLGAALRATASARPLRADPLAGQPVEPHRVGAASRGSALFRVRNMETPVTKSLGPASPGPRFGHGRAKKAEHVALRFFVPKAVRGGSFGR